MNFGFYIIKNKTSSLGLAKPQEACDGGAGSTKYFKRKKKEEDDEEQDDFDESVFDGVDDTDFLLENESTLAKKIFALLKRIFGSR